MNRVDLRIFQQFLVIGITPLHSKSVAGRIEFALRALTNRIQIRPRMALINRDKLSAEAKSNQSDINIFLGHIEYLFVRESLQQG